MPLAVSPRSKADRQVPQSIDRVTILVIWIDRLRITEN
jgi:hypothetical protein